MKLTHVGLPPPSISLRQQFSFVDGVASYPIMYISSGVKPLMVPSRDGVAVSAGTVTT
jgi:hypothetical protein